MSALHAPHLSPALLRSVGDGDVAVLRLLLREAEKGRGWYRRCRRGWRFAEEITAMGQHAGRLPWLAERGLLDRLDEREEGRRTPHWLYRVTNLGASVVAFRTGSEFRGIRRPARKRSRRDAGFFAPAGPIAALGGLVEAARRGDAGGWAVTAELRSILRTMVDPADLAWLVERGYAERREVGNGKQVRASHRATERGTRLRIVDRSATLRRRSARFVLVVADGPERESEPAGSGGDGLRTERASSGLVHHDLPRTDYKLLAYLRDEALAGRGWERRGRRGWRFAHELCAVDVPRWGLIQLHAAGLLDRIDERAPEKRRPLYLYRITDSGARWVAETREEEHRPIEAPGDDSADGESFFAPHRSISALRVLVGAGSGAWLDRHEIATRASFPASIEESDLTWLAEHRYAWKRERSTPQRRAVHEYAATACGRLLRVVAEDGIAFGRLSYVLVALGDGSGS